MSKEYLKSKCEMSSAYGMMCTTLIKNVEYVTEKYLVLYGSDFYDKYNKAEFQTVEAAIKFAGEKMDEGYDISVKQVNAVKGWEDYLHADVKLVDEDIDGDDYYGGHKLPPKPVIHFPR